jgi:hypothetical protein
MWEREFLPRRRIEARADKPKMRRVQGFHWLQKLTKTEEIEAPKALDAVS